MKESAPTGLFNILAQSADSIMNNENHCVERITNDLTLLHGAASGAVKVLYKGHYLEGGTSIMGAFVSWIDMNMDKDNQQIGNLVIVSNKHNECDEIDFHQMFIDNLNHVDQ